MVEISEIRKRLKTAMAVAREQAQLRRSRATEAEKAYETFLADVATPITRQVANALKAEGYAFTVFTPSNGLRLASDRGRDDFIEFLLETSGDRPQVVARISYARGSRTIEEERPVKAGAPPDAIGEEDVLEFLIGALDHWLER